jgi:large subunit ribosomal protein L32e
LPGPSPKKKRRKPKFIRSQGIHFGRLGRKWRKPRGIDSKMRYEIRGKPKRPKAGYGSNNLTRAVHPSGYREVLVHREGDLDSLDAKTQAARISSSVGLKKRERILSRAKELRIKIINR